MSLIQVEGKQDLAAHIVSKVSSPNVGPGRLPGDKIRITANEEKTSAFEQAQKPRKSVA